LSASTDGLAVKGVNGPRVAVSVGVGGSGEGSSVGVLTVGTGVKSCTVAVGTGSGAGCSHAVSSTSISKDEAFLKLTGVLPLW
jgi:hypothetical protein